MKTSQCTPRARAAKASACAWLPALPQTTPRLHASPAAETLFSAPRILNEPVRCSDSAFSRTFAPPARSLSVADGRTGVWRATSPTAARARSTSCAVTVIASAGERHDRVDLDLRALGQRRDADRHAGGGVCREEGRVGLVDLGKGGEVGHVDGQPNGVLERCPGGRADSLQVLETAHRLLGGRRADQLAAVGVERDLA